MCVCESGCPHQAGWRVKRRRAPACSGRHQRCFREYIFGASLLVTRETSSSVVSSFTVQMSSQENEGKRENEGVTKERGVPRQKSEGVENREEVRDGGERLN